MPPSSRIATPISASRASLWRNNVLDKLKRQFTGFFLHVLFAFAFMNNMSDKTQHIYVEEQLGGKID